MKLQKGLSCVEEMKFSFHSTCEQWTDCTASPVVGVATT